MYLPLTVGKICKNSSLVESFKNVFITRGNEAVLTKEVYNMKKLLIFAGHRKSCHSTVESIIDANIY